MKGAVINQDDSNLTVTVEKIPDGQTGSFMQRMNVQMNNAWNKFRCQFYTKAAIPSKMHKLNKI